MRQGRVWLAAVLAAAGLRRSTLWRYARFTAANRFVAETNKRRHICCAVERNVIFYLP